MPGQRQNSFNSPRRYASGGGQPLSPREQALLRFYQLRAQATAAPARRTGPVVQPYAPRGPSGPRNRVDQAMGWHPAKTLGWAAERWRAAAHRR